LTPDEPTNRLRDRSLIAAYFGRLAKSYGEGVYYARRRAAVMAAVACELRDARTILDLGCGNGAYLAELRKACKDARIFGADLSVEMLNEARCRIGAGADLAVGDATALPFRARCFDLILCSHVLQIVADLERCVGEAAQCLRSGGVLIATLGGRNFADALKDRIAPEQWAELYRAFTHAIGRGEWTRHGEQSYRAVCQGAGLAVESRSAPFSVVWRDIEELIGIRWMPLVPDQTREQFERIFKGLRADPRVGAQTFELNEGILLARKPVARV